MPSNLDIAVVALVHTFFWGTSAGLSIATSPTKGLLSGFGGIFSIAKTATTNKGCQHYSGKRLHVVLWSERAAVGYSSSCLDMELSSARVISP